MRGNYLPPGRLRWMSCAEAAVVDGLTPYRRDDAESDQPVMRNETSYFATEVRWPGVSLAGIALRTSSPRR